MQAIAGELQPLDLMRRQKKADRTSGRNRIVAQRRRDGVM
jgi:hypothetical protein